MISQTQAEHTEGSEVTTEFFESDATVLPVIQIMVTEWRSSNPDIKYNPIKSRTESFDWRISLKGGGT